MIKKSSLLMLIGNLFFTGLFAPKTPTPPTKDEMRAARVAFFSPAGGAAGSGVAVVAAPAVVENDFGLVSSFNLPNKEMLAYRKLRTNPTLQAVVIDNDTGAAHLVNFDSKLAVTNEIALPAGLFDRYSRVEYFPDGQSFLVLNDSQPIKIVDAATGLVKFEVNSPNGTDRGGNIPHISFSANGQKILLLCHRIYGNVGLAVVNANTGQEITSINDMNVKQADFHPNGLCLAAGSWVPDPSGRHRPRVPVVKAFDTDTGRVVAQTPPLSSAVRTVKYCCNGAAIAFALEDGLYKWEPGSGLPPVRWFSVQRGDYFEFSPDGNICVIYTDSSSLVIEFNRPRIFAKLPVSDIVFSPDSKLALCDNKETTSLVDANTFELIQEIPKDPLIHSRRGAVNFLNSSDGFVFSTYHGLELWRVGSLDEKAKYETDLASLYRNFRTKWQKDFYKERGQVFFPLKESLDIFHKEERLRNAFFRRENVAFLQLGQAKFEDLALIEHAAPFVKKLREIGDCCNICRLGACLCDDFNIDKPEKFCDKCQVNTRLRPESPGAFVTNCGHLFHKECIKTWFLTPGVSDLGANGIRRYRCPACQKHVTVPADFFDAAPALAGGAAGSR